MSSRFHLSCPDCGQEIVVDATTGAILDHQDTTEKASSRPQGAKPSLDALLRGLDVESDRSEARFQQELAIHRDRSRLLDEKFEEAKRRAEAKGIEGRPERPWDFE